MPVRETPVRPRGRSGRKRSVFALALVVGVGSVPLLIEGCSLDFTVRPDPGEAGNSSDGSSDAVVEGSVIVEGSAGDAASETSVPSDAGCDALFEVAEQKRVAARACVLAAGHCAEKEMGLCCETFVAQKGSAATAAFRSAVADFNNAKCNAGCTGCVGLPAVGGCVQNGAKFECSP